MSPPKAEIAPERVQQFVNDAHGDLDSVTRMLDEEPGLLNACWDWETGLGAAAHMGRGDIAGLLLDRGARIDLFAAAMLGKLEIVKAVVEDDPSAIDRKGPHGISLMSHARKGGKAAAEVVKYLKSR